MKKKNRPDKAPAAAPVKYVFHGDVFHTFVSEAQSLGNEVAARRAFDMDVCEYIAQKDLSADFEAWRAKKRG